MAGWTAPRTWTAAETVTAAIMNGAVRDNLLALNGYVHKSADESLNTSTTLQNDNHLLYAIDDTGTFEIDAWIYAASAADAAGDIKFGWSFPTGTLHFSGFGLDSTLASGQSGTFAAAAALSATSGTTALGFGLSTQNNTIHLHGHLAATATGTLQLMWAQVASNANNSTVKAGSHLRVRQVA